jgi:hypothetical protein
MTTAKNISGARYEYNDGSNCVELRWVVDGVVFNVEVRQGFTEAYAFDRRTNQLIGHPQQVNHDYLGEVEFEEVE